QAGVHSGRLRGPGVRRPARQLGAARGARRLPAPGAGRRRQPGADDHQHRFRARDQPGTARPVRQGGVTRVAFEDPGYGSPQEDETIRAAVAMGLHVSYVPVDEQGLVVGELVASGAQAVVVTPAHQSPTGVVMSPERRHALTDWARRGCGYVIEDDYDSEYRYDKEPVGALQGLAPDQVFLLGTASKALAPAVRLGWV